MYAGKDLHKLSLPTHINEPLTDLQRRAEAFEASELLDVVCSIDVSATTSSGLSYPMEFILVTHGLPSTLCLISPPKAWCLFNTNNNHYAYTRIPCICDATQLLDLVLLVLMQAALAPAQSLERLFHVTAFAISMYNTIKRVQKPFKNLEQSTYELIHLEKGIRCIGEKVQCLATSFPRTHNCPSCKTR